MKNPYHFNNKKEFNEAVNKKFKPLLNAEIEKYHKIYDEEIEKIRQNAEGNATKRAITLLLPVMSTSLYETLHIGEDKQEKVIQRLAEIMMECTNENIYEWPEYKEFCEKKGLKYFEMEVEK